MGIEDFLVDNLIRHEAIVDLIKLGSFTSEHDAHITNSTPDPVKDSYTVRYTPSSLGTSVHIECKCGAKEDITDYNGW